MTNNLKNLIGNTPLIKLSLDDDENTADIYFKLEKNNLAGSIKDRVALYMIEDAEKKGILKKGDTIVEPTSGNTGIALACIGALKGYNVILVMPHTMSKERELLAKAYGAKVIRTTEGGLKGSVNKAKELASMDGYFMPDQFNNNANVKAHYETTAPEILEKITPDAFVAGFGTGGTISGVGKYLKEKLEKVKIYAVEPAESPMLSKGYASKHKIQGIGANFVPNIIDKNIIDEIINIKSDDAITMTKLLAKKYGLLVGISSGANAKAALNIAKKLGKGKIVVSILPDTGERYLTTGIYDI